MCEICRSNPCHPRCPNYEVESSDLVCNVCGDYIYSDEEYIEHDKLYAHLDCFYSANEVLNWLEYPIYLKDSGGFYDD